MQLMNTRDVYYGFYGGLLGRQKKKKKPVGKWAESSLKFNFSSRSKGFSTRL